MSMRRMGDKMIALIVYVPIMVFGCMAVIEEATFDLVEELWDDSEVE